jgi:hypothetical protein
VKYISNGSQEDIVLSDGRILPCGATKQEQDERAVTVFQVFPLTVSGLSDSCFIPPCRMRMRRLAVPRAMIQSGIG